MKQTELLHNIFFKKVWNWIQCRIPRALHGFLYKIQEDLSRLITKPTKWHVRPVKTQISLGIYPVWSESSMSAWRNSGSLADAQADLSFHWAHMPFCWFCHEATQVLLYLILESYEPRHDKTNKISVHPAKTQISLGICPVWSGSSMCAQWVAKDPNFLHVGSKDSDQTGQMPRLIWVFAGRTVTLLVLSYSGSYSHNEISVLTVIYLSFLTVRSVVVELVFYSHFECGQLTYPHCSWASFLGSLPVHVLSAHSPVTDNCSSWISGRERMAVEVFSWQISTKECFAGCEDRTHDRPHPINPPHPACQVCFWRSSLIRDCAVCHPVFSIWIYYGKTT